MDCCFCERKNTKYTCAICGSPVCNICSVPINENDNRYDECNYRVGICPINCCTEYKTGDDDSGIGKDNENTMDSMPGNKIKERKGKRVNMF